MILHVNITVRNYEGAHAISRRVGIDYRYFEYGKGGFEETLSPFTIHNRYITEGYYEQFNITQLVSHISFKMECLNYHPIGWQRFILDPRVGAIEYCQRLVYSSDKLKDQMEENKEWCKENWTEPFLVYS